MFFFVGNKLLIILICIFLPIFLYYWHLFFSVSGLTNVDLREIQRQNQITKQILQNFLEKSLYGKRFSSSPSLLDILPNGIVRRSPSNNIQELLGNSTQESDKETLDSDETENVDSYYEDYDFDFQGNLLIILFWLI